MKLMSEYDWLSVPLGQSEEVEDDIIQLYSLGMNYANNHSLRKDLSLTLGSPLAVSLPLSQPDDQLSGAYSPQTQTHSITYR